MFPQLPLKNSASSGRSRILIRVGSAAVALLGITVLLAWHSHWTALLQVSANSAAIKYNIGLCFVFCSVGVILLTTRFRRLAVVVGGLATVVGIVTLLEYLTPLPFLFDEIFVRDYVPSTTDFPGRMTPLTAICFTLLGAALIVAAEVRTPARRLLLVASVACVVAVISAIAVVGYVGGIQEACGWGAHAHMAVHAAAALLILSLTLLEWTRQSAQEQHIDLLAWLPVVGSLTLMAMVAFVASVSLVHLRSSFDWSKHTYEVLLHANTLFVSVTAIELAGRDLVLTGQTAALQPYGTGIKNAPLQLTMLRTLTRDNASQIPRLDRLAVDITDISGYMKRLLALRDSAGIEAAVRLDASGEERILANRTRSDLQAFTDAERALLVTRNNLAAQNIFNTVVLLVLASILAVALLAWAHFRGTVETQRRRRLEGALQKLSALQTATLNAASYAIISSTVDRIITTFNATAERWLGYAAADVIGKVAPSAWYDDEEVRRRAQQLSAELSYSAAGEFDTGVGKARLGQHEENEWTMIRKDGSRFPVWRSVTAQIDNTGTIVGYVSVITDITERKEHEVQTRLSEERFRRAFDDAPIGMSLVDCRGRWLRVNRALCSMLGYSDTELLEKDVQSITYRDDRAASEEYIRQALCGTDPRGHLEKRYVRRDGSLVFANLSVSLVRDSRGVPSYFISQIEDVTERVAVDRMKSEFISTVSHELRTPLTSIRGALGLIGAGVFGELPEKARGMVEIAHQNSERLVRIINDILDVEKITSGKMEMQIENVPVAAFLSQAAVFHQPYGAKHEVRIIVEPPFVDASVLADPHRLMQVMANLLSNAAKFSPPGAEVRVRASECGARVRFEVVDRGTGIPEAFRGRVFEKFAQADSSSSRRFAGTGLGLSITRDFILAMNGTIGFDTVTGEGTTFHFELPCAHQTLQLPRCAPAAPSSRHKVLSYRNAAKASPQGQNVPRILYVEDDVDLSDVISAALAGRADLVTAGTLQAAEKLLRETSFSLVVLDIGLPDGNGLSLLEELPALTAGPIPVVILSAREVSQELQHHVAAALVKSRVSEAHVVTTILSFLPQALSPTPAAAVPQLSS